MRDRPRLKPRLQPTYNGGTVSIYIPEEASDLVIDDPQGKVASLVQLLDGSWEERDIYSELSRSWPDVTRDEVRTAIKTLDTAMLLENADAKVELNQSQIERYRSNLAFFARYETLSVSRFALQRRVCSAKVVLLGVGGTGSLVLMNLAGLGVGRIEVVDDDVVQTANLVRQFLYRESDVGRSKVEAAAAFARGINSETEVTTHAVRVTDGREIEHLIGDADLVVMAVDRRLPVLVGVNRVCVAARVPFICGGFSEWGGLYFSVWPGHTGCVVCGGAPTEVLPEALATSERVLVNPGIGPASSLIGSLVSMEALRYISRFAEPVSAGKVWAVEFASGEHSLRAEWQQEPDCPVCAAVAVRPALSTAR